MSESDGQQPSTFGKKLAIGGMVGIVALMVLAFISAKMDPSIPQSRPSAQPFTPIEAGGPDVPEAADNDPTMTMAEFGALRPGISYADAVAIIGSPGKLVSESSIVGVSTAMYQWEGEGSFGANANAMFQDDKLIQKAQYGLE